MIHCFLSLLYRITFFRIAALLWWRVLGLASANLREICCPTPGEGPAEDRGTWYPLACSFTRQKRAFSVVGLRVERATQGPILTHSTRDVPGTQLPIRYSVSAVYFTTRYLPDPVK